VVIEGIVVIMGGLFVACGAICIEIGWHVWYLHSD
jgi:hypothetical protein